MIIECTEKEQVALTFPVMRQLRPHFTNGEAYSDQVLMMMADYGYRLIACFKDGLCCGAGGFTVDYRLFSEKTVYIADLVVDEASRSSGVGKALLDWINDEARRIGCKTILLDSGVHRAQAHKFYFREGFIIGSFNFKKILSGNS